MTVSHSTSPSPGDEQEVQASAELKAVWLLMCLYLAVSVSSVRVPKLLCVCM